jgi:peptidoglycan/LPS O-acetylase OafA/YrhL
VILEITSIAPYFVIMALLLFIGRLFQSTPVFSHESDVAVRYKSLDGLRGFLSLAVFFHHAVARYFYELTGVWEYPKGSVFYTVSPQAAVAMFFMITGFLFWLKIIKVSGKLNWWKLLMSRTRRLVPAYVASIIMLFIIIGFATNWKLQVPLRDLVSQLVRWLSFNFLTLADINGFKETWTLQGVIWSLKFEWAFIFALPFVAIVYKPKKFVIFFIVGLLFWTYTSRLIIMANFMFGMLAAYSIGHQRLQNILQTRFAAVVGLLSLGALYSFFLGTDGLIQIGLMFVFFLVVVNGNDLFGLLSLKGSQYLGAISYSMYLFHGLLLFLAFVAFKHAFGPLVSAVDFWLLVCATGVATVVVSSITFKFIEEPFIRHMR